MLCAPFVRGSKRAGTVVAPVRIHIYLSIRKRICRGSGWRGVVWRGKGGGGGGRWE